MMISEVFELSPVDPWKASALLLWLFVWFAIWLAAWFWADRSSRSMIVGFDKVPPSHRTSTSPGPPVGGSKSRSGSGAAGIILVLLSFGLVATGFHTYALTHARIEIDDEEIRFVSHNIYSIARDQLILSKAIEVDLDQRPSFSPSVHLDGFVVPGFRSGWYRLENGIRSYVLLTNQKTGVLIPTRENYAVFVSPIEVGAFLDALKRSPSQ